MPISFSEKDDVITMDSPKHSPKGGRPLKSSFLKRTTSSIKNETSSKNSREGGAEEVVAILDDNSRWILVDSKDKSQQKGGIYLEGNLLTGSWPAPKDFCKKLEAKKLDGSPISGFIHFHQRGADYGTFEFNINGKFKSKVVTFKKNSKNRWRSDDGYFLSVDGNNVISANFSLLCRMAKSNFVMLCDPNNNNNKTIGVCNFYDGDTQLGVIAFGQGGAHVSDFTGGYNKSGGQVEFYDSIEEWFGKDQLYMKIRNCNGNISLLVRDPDIKEIITGANLDPDSGKYSDYADAIWDRAAQREEIVAFFDNPEWVLAKGSGEEVGKILKGEEAFIGAWPAPEVFYNTLVAKKYNGDAVEGQIKFYTDSGLYVGDIEFSENGQGTQALPPENVEFNEETSNTINFKKAFLIESSKSKNSEWNTLTSVSAIRDKILEEPDFTTRLKNHLILDNKYLNKDGLNYLNNIMKITLPERYEVEAACLVYLNFLNNNKSDTNENDDPNTVSFKRAENRAWYAVDNGGNPYYTNENDDPNTVSFERAENSAWYAFDNGGNPYYTIRIEGSDSEVAASDYVIYKMIQDKLIKVYKIDKYALINPGAGSHKFEFVETVEAKCGLTIEINDEGEVTKSTCKSDNDDAGYKAFYDKAKLVLGEEEFKKQIIDSSGSMSSIAKLYDIAEILKSKNLDPASREYGKFAEAIEEYIKEGKNGTQKEKSAQPDGESKSSPSDASAQVSGQKEIIFKKPIYAMTWYSDPNFDKQIAVQYHSSSGNKGSREDINYALLYRMVKDKIVKLYDEGGKTISATCRIKSNDDKDFGTITFNNGDVSSHTLKPPTDDEGDKGKLYDCIRELLGVSDLKEQLVRYDGNLIHMVRGIGIISDIIQKAGKNINSYDHGDFANAIEEYIKDKDKDKDEVTKSTCKSDNDDADYKAFYDKAKLVLGEEEFKKQIIDSSGSMGSIASVDKIAKILKSKNLDPASREYGKFAEAIEEYIKDKETLENAKNEALKDLYTKASALGISITNETESISEFNATDFAKKLLGSKFITLSKVKKKLRALGRSKDGKEKQIDLLTRLLMRMERKKDFEKNHKFGKIRYAFGEREKTDPKIKKCFEAAGKYIVKNYDKIDKKNLDRKRANLRSIFSDLRDEEKQWTIKLCEGLDNTKTVIKYNDQDSCKAIMGIIFASMAGIEKSKDLICACDALKKGGIKSSKKGTFLGDASQIRKSIKALCGRDGTTYDTRKAVIKKLLVNDYKFINGSYCNELFPPKTSK